ncbi:MAG TPA: AAA family ATPase [Solirubrobacteraceae bacterium]|nr:AAA family ATPase [Solirubrobacteraceae bacterium]
MPTARESPFVGRVRELRGLEDAFEDACHGRGGMQILLGEPGVGKTRLANALVEHARAHDARVVETRGWAHAGPAYWPWVEIVRALSADLGGEALRRELRSAADQLLRLVPELGARLPGAQAPALEPGDDEIARFALFDALAALLRARSVRDPVVIAIDDLQVVDTASLVALDFISRILSDVAVLIVATMHEHTIERSPEAEVALQNIGRAGRRLPLGGLAREDIGRLIELASGGRAAPGLATTVHAVTEGNPFFAGEIIALLLAERRLQDPPDELPLPDGVRATIRRRLEPLDAAALETLELAAVIGRTFTLATLERASPQPRDTVLGALDEAVKLGLVAPVAGAIGEYRFGHGLIRDTLIYGMTVAARMSAHRVVGEALEHNYRGAVDEHLPELAHHFLAAGSRGDVAKAVAHAERAAQRALDALAYEQAEELFSRALEALEALEQDVPRRAGLLLGLGTAQSRLGRAAARATFEAAIQAARAIDADDIFARAALGFGPFALTPGYVDEQHVALLGEALERIGPDDDPMRVRLLGSLAVALYWSDTAARRAELADEALAIARRLGDDVTLAIALSSAQLATSGPDTTEQGLEWLRELFAITDRVGETVMSLAARSRHIDALMELDDLAGADIAIETLERLARGARDRRAAMFVPLHRARRAALDGRYEDAESLLGEVEAIVHELSASTIPITAASQRVVLTWLQKGPREIGDLVRAYADGSPAMPCWRAGLAAALADAGRRDEARLELERLVAGDCAGLPRDNLWLAAMALLSEAVAALDAPEHAELLYGKLAPFAGRNVVLPTVAYLGPVEMWLGILARIARRSADTHERLAAARVQTMRAGARPALARIAVEEAAVLIRDGGTVERARAGELLDDAGRSCEQMGLERIAQHVEALRAQLSAIPAPAAGEPAAGSQATRAALQRNGDVWTLRYEGATLHLTDGKGIQLLALLLERPGAEVHCLELAAAVAGSSASAPIEHSGGQETSGRFGVQGGAGPMLDARAKEDYRAEIARLGAALGKAEARRDVAEAARVRAQLEFVRAELARSVGKGGRDRETGSHAERARINVTRHIRRTLTKIAGYDEALGAALDRCVRTGAFCVYAPDPVRPLRWTVRR